MFYSYTRRRHPKISVMSYSTYPIKLQLFWLILPIAISALKGLVDLKMERKEKKKEKERNEKKEDKKSPKKRKTTKSLFSY